MKTEGLTFNQAVQALYDRKCPSIRHANHQGGTFRYVLRDDDWLACSEVKGGEPVISRDFALNPKLLLDPNWQLVDPIIPTRTVTERRWRYKDGSMNTPDFEGRYKEEIEKGAFPAGQWVTVTYEEEIEEPEQEPYISKVKFNKHLGSCVAELLPLNWVGKKVSVTLIEEEV